MWSRENEQTIFEWTARVLENLSMLKIVTIEVVKKGCGYTYSKTYDEYHYNWQNDYENISEKNEIDPDKRTAALPKLFHAINDGFTIRGKARDKDPERRSYRCSGLLRLWNMHRYGIHAIIQFVWKAR